MTEDTGKTQGLSAAEILAGLPAEERTAFILSLLQTPEGAKVASDKAVMKKASEDAEAARLKAAESMRLELIAELQPSIVAVFNDAARTRMIEAGLLGFDVRVGPTGDATYTPVVKSARASGGTGSGGSASPTGVKAVMGLTPAELFAKYASEVEREFYKAISGYQGGSPAYIFQRAVFVPKALEDGTISKTDETDEGKKMRRYVKSVAENWAKSGEAGVFNTKTGETFADLRRKAAAAKAEK